MCADIFAAFHRMFITMNVSAPMHYSATDNVFIVTGKNGHTGRVGPAVHLNGRS